MNLSGARARLAVRWPSTLPTRERAGTALRTLAARLARWEAGIEALKVFVLSRVVLMLVSLVAVMSLPIAGAHGSPAPATLWHAWYRYDAIAFASLARFGYSRTGTAYFPLWPALIHVVGSLFGGSLDADYWVALALANVCFFVALVLLYALLAGDFSADLARRATFYLAIYSYALFFFAGYSESLFLLLSLGIFLALRRQRARRWWLAGGLGLLAALTRATAVALIVPFLVLWWQRVRSGDLRGDHAGTSWRSWWWRVWWRRVVTLAPAALVPAGVALYMLYLGRTMGDPLLFQVIEGRVWGRRLAPPWAGLFAALHALLANVLPSLNLMDLLFTLLPLVVLALGWRRLPAHYSSFAAALALLALLAPTPYPEALASAPRYLMVAFPIFVILGRWGERPWFDRAYVALASATLALNVVLFATHHWVA